MDTPSVSAFRGPFIAALAAERVASGVKGPTFAKRVNEAANADPSLGAGRWTRMTVHNLEHGRNPILETTVRRYAAALDMEAVVVLVPKGASRVVVDILDPESAP